jgi:hypothetical protein
VACPAGKTAELMAALSTNDVNSIRMIMQRLVSGYTPSEEIVDWFYMEQETELQRGT